MNRETAILQLMHTSGIGSKGLSRLLKRLHSESYPIEDFVSAPKNDLVEKYGLTEEMSKAIKADTEKIQLLSEELWKHEIKIVELNDPSYPDVLTNVLAKDSPPVLFVKGTLSILNKRAVGFCGSRKASENGCQLVKNAAAAIANMGVNVISGYAHGIDLAAHIGSLETGGVTTFVLPLGILNFQLKSSIAELLTEDNYLVISEFIPRLGWEVHNAMRRNLTTCGLSKVIILVEPGLKGGTFEAGKTALKYNRPLFVVEHDQIADHEGNKYFMQRGAKALHENTDGKLNLEVVLESINSEEPKVRQQSLF